MSGLSLGFTPMFTPPMPKLDDLSSLSVNCTSNTSISLPNLSMLRVSNYTRLKDCNGNENQSQNEENVSGFFASNGKNLINREDYQKVLERLTLKLQGMMNEVETGVSYNSSM